MENKLFRFCYQTYVINNKHKWFEVTGKDNSIIYVDIWTDGRCGSRTLDVHIDDSNLIEYILLDGKRIYADQYYDPQVSTFMFL